MRREAARASLWKGITSAPFSSRLKTTIWAPTSLSITRLRILALKAMMVVESANMTSWATTQPSGKRIYRSPTCCMPFSSATTRSALYFFCRD